MRIVWRRDLIRFASDRTQIVTWLIQPLLFLFVLGSGLQSLSAAVHRRRRPQDVHLPRRPLHGGGVQRRCSAPPRWCGTASSGSCGR